jgi:hypothetical protein
MAITINGTTGLAGVDGSAGTPAVQGTDTNTGLIFGTDTVSIVTGGTTRATADSSGNFQYNSGYGSVATVYGCRAWVNFNGTGTVAIRASGNVSSITDNGTGDYTVNFTNAMPDANYGVCITGGALNSSSASIMSGAVLDNTAVPTTSALRIICANGTNTVQDYERVYVVILR